MLVAISQIDDALGSTLEGILAKGHNEDRDPTPDSSIDQTPYQTYASELYGVVVALTAGGTKSVVEGISGGGGYLDGFEALLAANRRLDSKILASRLHAFMEAVGLKPFKISEISKGIHAWEARVSGLKSQYDEDLNSNIKLATLIGMLPKEYEDICVKRDVPRRR